jgi:hypothetical protein
MSENKRTDSDYQEPTLEEILANPPEPLKVKGGEIPYRLVGGKVWIPDTAELQGLSEEEIEEMVFGVQEQHLEITPEEEEAYYREISHWGRERESYLKATNPEGYAKMVANGTLNEHLSDIEERATRAWEQITSQMKASELQESWKDTDPMRWIRGMRAIESQAEEIIRAEIINS